MDEAVALAAGHRPCWQCRRQAYEAFVNAWGFAMRLQCGEVSRQMDEILHHARIHSDRQVTFSARLADIPSGSMIRLDNRPREVHLLWEDRLYQWQHAAYGVSIPVPGEALVTVLTPAPIVAVLRAGYVPMVAPRA